MGNSIIDELNAFRNFVRSDPIAEILENEPPEMSFSGPEDLKESNELFFPCSM